MISVSELFSLRFQVLELFFDFVSCNFSAVFDFVSSFQTVFRIYFAVFITVYCLVTHPESVSDRAFDYGGDCRADDWYGLTSPRLRAAI